MSDTLTISTPRIEDADVFSALADNRATLPQWLQNAQQQAWSKYLELPTPVRTSEPWRFAHLARLKGIGSFRPCPQAPADPSGAIARSKRLTNVSARLVFVDDHLVDRQDPAAELTARGIVFCTLREAIQSHPELVEKYFMKESPELGSEKYEALHLALLNDGAFLYIPDGVEVDAPFVVAYWAETDGAALFPHTTFVCGRNAKANLVEFQQGVNTTSSQLVIANAHLHAGDGSQPNHTIVQDWNLNTLSFQLNTNNAQRDTTATSTLINVGSIQARQEIHGKIFGSGSNVEMYALNVPKGEQEFDQRTLQSHIAPHSRSDLLFKSALLDKSRTIFSGLIIVEENAQQTDAYQTNNNLMVSDEAEANSLPGLEIKANDVKCSHGATTGRIDQSELFYFLARGITPAKARELMVFGYFEEIISKTTNVELADFIRDLVQHKFTD